MCVWRLHSAQKSQIPGPLSLLAAQQSPTSLYLCCPPSPFTKCPTHSDHCWPLTITQCGGLAEQSLCVVTDSHRRTSPWSPLCLQTEYVKNGAYTTSLMGLRVVRSLGSRRWYSVWTRAGEAVAVARFQERTKAATLPSRLSPSVPGTDRLQRRMGFCRLEDCTFDSFELLYSGAVDKIKSQKSNLNLSKCAGFKIRTF